VNTSITDLALCISGACTILLLGSVVALALSERGRDKRLREELESVRTKYECKIVKPVAVQKCTASHVSAKSRRSQARPDDALTNPLHPLNPVHSVDSISSSRSCDSNSWSSSGYSSGSDYACSSSCD